MAMKRSYGSSDFAAVIVHLMKVSHCQSFEVNSFILQNVIPTLQSKTRNSFCQFGAEEHLQLFVTNFVCIPSTGFRIDGLKINTCINPVMNFYLSN